MDKPNCYDCIHRRGLAGSAHSQCVHPETTEVHVRPMADLIALLGKRSGVPIIPSGAAIKLKIAAAQHGIVNGWFIWPLNFDPVWLTNCEGFEAKNG